MSGEPLGGGELVAKLGDQLIDALPGFGGDEDRVFGGEAEDLLDFLGDADRIGAGQVDLVDDGDDFEADIDGGVGVGDGLSLHALRGVDDEDRPFAGLEGFLDFVVKIDMAGGVDEVQHELFAVMVVKNGDGGGFDGDAALALEIHVVEDLLFEFAFGDGAGSHEQAVGERALAVVDMGDDREITNLH